MRKCQVWKLEPLFFSLQMAQNREETSFTLRKTGYNRHFPRSFLLNYGPALQNPSDEAILSRLRDFNCEWLKRPNIAASEFAMTIKDNMPLIRQFSGTVFTEAFVEDLLESFDPLIPAMKRLDNKDKTDQTPPSREDVTQVLKNVDENETLQVCIMDGYNAAGALMMFTTHMLAIQTLMRNTEEFAEKTTRSTSSQHFKSDPTPRGMRNFILDGITKRRRPIPRHISVWDEDDDNEETRAPQSRSRRGSTQTRSRTQATTSNWEEQDQRPRTKSAQKSEKPNLEPSKRKRKTKRTSSTERQSELEEERQQCIPRYKRRKTKSNQASTSKQTSESSESSSSEEQPKKKATTTKEISKTSAKPKPRYRKQQKQQEHDKQSKQQPDSSSTSSSSTHETSKEDKQGSSHGKEQVQKEKKNKQPLKGPPCAKTSTTTQCKDTTEKGKSKEAPPASSAPQKGNTSKSAQKEKQEKESKEKASHTKEKEQVSEKKKKK